jgi:hypothetical protein
MSRHANMVATGALVAACLGVSARSEAQAQGDGQPRVAVSVGADWLGATDIGGVDATETANGPSPARRQLFATSSELDGGVGVSGSLALRLMGPLWGEASVRYHSARIFTEVSDDLEGANGTATESLQQLQIEGGALFAPDTWLLGPFQLYLSGGAGYLRQLHSGQTLVEEGQSFYVGAGAILWLPQRPGRTFRAVGLRIDPRAVLLRDGVALDDRVHVAPAVTASLFLRF